MMNWTGGSLQRTKKANQGTVQKQKAFFSRARTQPEKASNLSVTQFRPSYLQHNETFEVTARMPPFGSGSVRHAGHSARSRREVVERMASPEEEKRESGPNVRSQHKVASHRMARRAHFGDIPGGLVSKETKRGKQPDEHADLETQLLDANRKRLLKQSDWIGVAPSRPVHLRFKSSKEKSRIGKRRRVRSKRGATMRRTDHTDLETRLQPGDNPPAFTDEVIHNKPDEVRIRIGTDALTTACSTRPNENHSHASSEPMLFDEPGLDTPRPDTQETAQTATMGSRAADCFPQEDNTLFQESLVSNKQPQHYRTRGVPSDHQETLLGENRTVSRGATPSGPRITQHVEGIEHTLRLVFDSPNSSTGARSRTAWLNDNNDDMHDALAGPHAQASRRGSMHDSGSEDEQFADSEALTAAAIVDGVPWKSYLPISARSSSHITSSRQGKSALHSHPTVPQNEAERSWSQHATQGGQNNISSSLTSASLPSLESSRYSHTHVRGSQVSSLDNRSKQRRTTTRDANDDEKLVQGFVFGSSDDCPPDTMYQYRFDEELRRCSSGYLPLSVAVSSSSRTPFRPASRTASRMSGEVHDTQRYTLHAGLSSPARPAGFVEELSWEEEGEEPTERSTCGDPSETRASLRNNASCTSPSRIYGHTETSRSGHGPSHQRWSNAAPRRIERRSSWEMQDSDDEGIDLVDPDTLV